MGNDLDIMRDMGVYKAEGNKEMVKVLEKVYYFLYVKKTKVNVKKAEKLMKQYHLNY